MSPSVRLRLSLMMFLQYFVWGSWFVSFGTYIGKTLQFSGDAIGWSFAAIPIAGMISPFFAGLIADRYFSAERLLGVLHLMGAALLYYASSQTTFGGLFPVLLLYSLTFMPTLSLTNSIALHQLQDPAREFPGIRVLGTIGWIAAGVLVGKLRLTADGTWGLALFSDIANSTGVEATQWPMLFGAATAAVMGVLSFIMPHTPPKAGKAAGVSEILGLDALKLMKDRSFAIFVIGSFLICIPLQFYYGFTNQFLDAAGVKEPAFKMSFGQMSELFFMLLMPLFFVRLGVKNMLLIGMAAWVARYLLFASMVEPLMITGLILHGICYDFFFVTGQIYVDQKAPRELRGAAQGFIAFATLGFGQFIGSVLGGRTLAIFEKANVTPREYHWNQFWLVPAALAFVVLVIFAVMFKDDGKRPAGDTPLH